MPEDYSSKYRNAEPLKTSGSSVKVICNWSPPGIEASNKDSIPTFDSALGAPRHTLGEYHKDAGNKPCWEYDSHLHGVVGYEMQMRFLPRLTPDEVAGIENFYRSTTYATPTDEPQSVSPTPSSTSSTTASLPQVLTTQDDG